MLNINYYLSTLSVYLMYIKTVLQSRLSSGFIRQDLDTDTILS
jgi:hypothetical protein